MNTLMPAEPSRRSSIGMSSTFSRVPPTKNAKSQNMRWRARLTLSASSSAVVVSGLVFGISNTAVTPPMTAPRLPVSRSSLWVSPGSRKCTCVSMTPGRMVQALAVDDLGGAGAAKRAQRGDAARFDANIAHARAVMIDDGGAAEDEVVVWAWVPAFRCQTHGLRGIGVLALASLPAYVTRAHLAIHECHHVRAYPTQKSPPCRPRRDRRHGTGRRQTFARTGHERSRRARDRRSRLCRPAVAPG